MAILSRTIVAALICAPILTSQAAPVTYQMDTTHTFVLLSRGNYGFSNPYIVANIDRGTLVFDHDDPSKSSVHVTVPVSKISTFVPHLDIEIRSPMFFDMEKFPDITFQSTRVQAAGQGKYTIKGNLTAHGVTRPMVLHARMNKAGENPMTSKRAIGFDATGTLKRSEFGLNFNIPNVSDEIVLKLTMQADAMK
jgi:polyisoprenoid-binding protein YceI